MDKKIRKIIFLFLLALSVVVIYLELNNKEKINQNIVVEEIKEYSKPEKFEISKKIKINFDERIPTNKICYTYEQCIELSELYLSALSEISENIEVKDIEMVSDGDKIGDIENRKILGKLKIVNEDLEEIDFDISERKLQNLNEIFNIFIEMVPKKWRENVTQIEVYENNFSAAYVDTLMEEKYEQLLGINVDDVNVNKYGIAILLIHELGHIFSLNINQYLNVNCEEEIYGENLECFMEDSYINQFYKAFYTNVPKDWKENSDKIEEDFQKFYELNEENYVSAYALNNIYEDFAESFLWFVTEFYPEGDEGYKQKILFFYQYPELVLLRAELLKNIIEKELVGTL